MTEFAELSKLVGAGTAMLPVGTTISTVPGPPTKFSFPGDSFHTVLQTSGSVNLSLEESSVRDPAEGELHLPPIAGQRGRFSLRGEVFHVFLSYR
jgi:hypothetical protein